MISIQELGSTILSSTPKQFYVIGGQEYGVKDKYIDALTRLYGKKEEYPTVSSVIDLLSVKHIVPLKPSLYIIRYDESFVSSISQQLAHKIKSLKFKGTIICVYTDQKQVEKIDKFLPDCTGIVESINPKFIEKYLHSDFPKLDDRSIKVATMCASSYGHARTICKSMIHADPTMLAKMSEKDLIKLFGCDDIVTESEIQKAVAGRNFASAAKLIEGYDGSLDTIVYTILQTMIEMEKILTSKYSDSPLKDYAKVWKLEDVYYMFMNAYDELSKLRSNTSSNVKSSLIYLFGLFTFKDIPSPEVMNSEL